MRIELYKDNYKCLWDSFVDNSKNGTFLHKRDYMEYHKDRFEDFSLMVFDESDSEIMQLIALLPANIVDDTVYSHRGLTYGALILSQKNTQSQVVEIFETIKDFLKINGVKKLIYKTIPQVYHKTPSQEDLYAIFCLNGTLIDRKVSSAIYQRNNPGINNSRKKGVKRAVNHGITLEENIPLDSFWNILSENLNSRFDVNPVHTLPEIISLQQKFPDNIICFGAKCEQEIVAGVVIYLTDNCAHAQYTSASLKGKKINAVDLLYDAVINKIYKDKNWFDFGVSTEPYDSKVLNKGLIAQKESFGARAIMYDTYEIKIS